MLQELLSDTVYSIVKDRTGIGIVIEAVVEPAPCICVLSVRVGKTPRCTARVYDKW